MNSMEQKKRTEAIKEINKLLTQDYQTSKFPDGESFCTKDCGIFRMNVFTGEFAIVIEYAENEQEAELGRFEDGYIFYLDDYGSVDELYSALKSEIENF